MRITLAVAIVAVMAISGGSICAQPNPYHVVENWVKLPAGRTFGSVGDVSVDSKGNVWAFERCGANTCAGSNLAPILEFDTSGNLLKSFGAGMLVFPHALYVDKDGNVWVTDAAKIIEGRDGATQDLGGKGSQVFKFSPEGRVLLVLGKAGGPVTFNTPTAVVTAPNGDIFVTDGHGGDTNHQILKFSKEGKFIKAWGKKGSAPGEFDDLHAIAMDSQGRLFVGDRGNNRIQIFNQDGKLLGEWKQFGRPSGIFIDANDSIYVSSTPPREFLYGDTAPPTDKMGIRIGSAKDGVVKAFIPETIRPDGKPETAVSGVAADAMGNIYAADGGYTRTLRKYAKH